MAGTPYGELPLLALSRALEGESAEAAALVAVLDPSGLDAVHQVQAWLAAHQPRVPVEIGAPPGP